MTKQDREQIKGHKGCFILLTGLSGAGKSTLAFGLEEILNKNNLHTYHLDGDVLRQGINKNLNFTPEDRKENIRRLAEIGNLFVNAGIVTLASFIAPLEENRNDIRSIVGNENYLEIYVSTPLSVCEERDVKGLYIKARNGEIPNFTGIGSVYETPLNPNYTVDTSFESIELSLSKLTDFILSFLSTKNE